jgi:hypothetical protein
MTTCTTQILSTNQTVCCDYVVNNSDSCGHSRVFYWAKDNFFCKCLVNLAILKLSKVRLWFTSIIVIIVYQAISTALSGSTKIQTGPCGSPSQQFLTNANTFTLVRVRCGRSAPRRIVEKRQTLVTVRTRGVVLAPAYPSGRTVQTGTLHTLAGVSVAFAPGKKIKIKL